MNVDVDSRRFDREIDEIVRLRVGGNELVVAVDNRLVEVGVLHVPSVDEEKLQSAATASVFGASDESRNGDNRCARFDGYELLVDGARKECGNSFFERIARH